MKKGENSWGSKEFEGDGISCPVIPAKLPWYKKAILFFFRFGVCPLCVTMSLIYGSKKLFKKTSKQKQLTNGA